MKFLRKRALGTLNHPVFLQSFHGWATVFWIWMIPVSVVTGLISSVAYVSALSLWALVASH